MDSHLKDLGIDGRTISEWIFKTYKGRTGKGLIWFFAVKVSRDFTGVLRIFGLTLLYTSHQGLQNFEHCDQKRGCDER
jgi:hypothetical protein